MILYISGVYNKEIWREGGKVELCIDESSQVKLVWFWIKTCLTLLMDGKMT